MYRHLKVADALLLVAIDVVRERVARLLAGLDKRLMQRIL